MTGIRDIPSAYTSGLQGIQRGVLRFEQSAANVAAAGPAENNAAVLHISEEARAAASAAPSLEESLIDSHIATHDVAANVSVLQASDEMSAQLLAMFDKR